MSRFFPAITDYHATADIYVSWLARIEVFSENKLTPEPTVRKHTGGFYVYSRKAAASAKE